MILEQRIKNRMDALQHWMESNYHLKNPQAVSELADSVSKFWSVLSEEDRDYISGARYAIECNLEWKVE